MSRIDHKWEASDLTAAGATSVSQEFLEAENVSLRLLLTQAEVSANPRAASVRLRAAERVRDAA